VKKITCRELGGACDLEFSGNTFGDVAALSQAHGMEMSKAKDAAHLAAMSEMGKLMNDPKDMKKWMLDKESYFNNLPDV
jgi:hypothetical protein